MPISSQSNIDINYDIESMSRGFEETSFFEMTCDFLIGINEEFNNANKVFYRSLLESGESSQIITESFSDFFSKIKEIIDKIIEFIKKLFNKFIISFNKLIGSDTYLKKHLKDLDKFKDEDKFTFSNGYEYTFNPNIPSVDVLIEFGDSFVFDNYTTGNTPNAAIKDKINALKTAETKNGAESSEYKTALSELIDACKTHYEKLTNELDNGTRYDKYRQDIIGAKTPIDDNEYSDELFSVFRDDTSDSSDIDVDKSYINKAITRYKGYDKLIKNTKKQRTEIERAYKNIKKNIEDLSSSGYDGDKKVIRLTSADDSTSITNILYNQELSNEIDTYLKAKCNEVETVSNLHTMAFSAKLDAINAALKQDKSILYRGLQKVNGFRHEGVSLVDLGSTISILDPGYYGKEFDVEEKESSKELNFSFGYDLLSDLKLK